MKENECLISKKLADLMEIKVGEIAIIYGSFYDYYGSVKEKYEYETFGFSNETYNAEKVGDSYYMLSISSYRSIPCIVKDFLGESYGKFSDGSMERMILMEHKYFFKNIAYYMSPIMFPFAKYMFKANPDEFVQYVHINIPDRLDVYLG
jgi:CTP:phosphocholine cytidylyltransferase-like protein